MNILLGILIATLIVTFLTADRSKFPFRSFLSNLLSISVLTYVILSSNGRLPDMIASVASLYFGVYYLNTLLEALFFRIMSLVRVLHTLATGAVVTGISAPLLVIMLCPRQTYLANQIGTTTLKAWIAHIAAADLLYVALYFLAGVLTFPFVRHHYRPSRLPMLSHLIAMQLLRGCIYICCSWPAICLLTGASHTRGLAIGSALCVLGGAAPLILPNPTMPPDVRLAHAVEISVSNFLFGIALGYLVPPTHVTMSIT